MEIHSLENIFQQCGFNLTESKLLSLLSQEELASPARLAKISELKRPTVYAALENLVLAGVVLKEKRHRGSRFSLAPRGYLHEILDDRAKLQYEKVRKASLQLQQTLKDIPQIPSRKMGSFEIRSLETKSLIHQQLVEALMSGDFVGIFNPQLIPQAVLKITTLPFLKKTSQSQPHIREIAVDGEHTNWYEKNISNKNHKLKRLPNNAEIYSDIIMFEGNVIITHHDKGNELGLRIHEERFYRSLRTVFELLWSKI